MKKRAVLNLRALRKEKGWTFSEMSKRSDVPMSTYQAIEDGRGANFSAITKHKIADALGVNFFDLFPEARATVEALIGGRSIQEFITRNDRKKE